MNDKKNYVYFENLLPPVLLAAQKKPCKKPPCPGTGTDNDNDNGSGTGVVNNKANCEKVISSDDTKKK